MDALRDVMLSIERKVKIDYPELDQEEREKLEDMMIDYFTVHITNLSDEMLMQEAVDMGVV